jgi:hypothetical protein
VEMGQFFQHPKSKTDMLVGWQRNVCVRDIGGERQEESVRVTTE